jgi:hypothetical protein
MTKMYDIEEQILKCWEITEDLWLVAGEHEDDDDISNKVLGLKHVYEMRFNKLWKCYEEALKEMFEERKKYELELSGGKVQE